MAEIGCFEEVREKMEFCQVTARADVMGQELSHR